MGNVEETMILLQLYRNQLKQQEFNKKMERVTKLVDEAESKLEVANEELEVKRSELQIVEFVRLSEHYMETLELISDKLDSQSINDYSLHQTVDLNQKKFAEATNLLKELLAWK